MSILAVISPFLFLKAYHNNMRMELSLLLKKIKWQNGIEKGLMSEKTEKAVIIKFIPTDQLPIGYLGVSLSKNPVMNALVRNSEL